MKIRREWAMPCSLTFQLKPVKELVERYVSQAAVIVDPFARDSEYAHWRNDLNPDTRAANHLDAIDFLDGLHRMNVVADLVLFDPPYSPRQIKECYQGVGRQVTQQDTQSKSWARWKDAIAQICRPGSVVISCGWNSGGLGSTRGFEVEEILLVPHGGWHNDTIVTVERMWAEDALPWM